jgi:hypothetical protein
MPLAGFESAIPEIERPLGSASIRIYHTPFLDPAWLVRKAVMIVRNQKGIRRCVLRFHNVTPSVVNTGHLVHKLNMEGIKHTHSMVVYSSLFLVGKVSTLKTWFFFSVCVCIVLPNAILTQNTKDIMTIKLYFYQYEWWAPILNRCCTNTTVEFSLTVIILLLPWLGPTTVSY